MTSWGIHLGTTLRSLRGVMTPSMLPNMDDRPKVKSMIKNNMAHTCEPGISMTASVNAIKARPVPEADCGIKNEMVRCCKREAGEGNSSSVREVPDRGTSEAYTPLN